MRRRNYTLTRMAEVGFISPSRSGGRAQEADRHCAASRRAQPSVAPYFLEEVRKELEARYGAKQLYENGLSIQTALDSRCRRPPTARWTTGCGGSTSGAASASRGATSSPKASTIDAFKHPLGAADARRRHRAGGRPHRQTPPRSTRAPATLQRHRSTRRASPGPRKPANQLVNAGDLIEVRLGGDWTRPRRPPAARSSSRRWSKARSSRSTTAPARSRRWSAATASSAASSIARRRRSGRSARRSSRSSTPPRSIAATRRRR